MEDLKQIQEFFSKPLEENVDKKYSDFLVALRDSGVTNMFGAGPYLQAEFGLDKREAREILANWMRSFGESLSEGKQLDIEDFAKVVKAVEQTGHPVTVLLVPKFNEIEVITGMNAPDDMLFDLSNAVDSLGYGRNDIFIAGDSSNLSRREYSDIRRVNGGAKDYFEESLDEAKRPEPNYKELVKLLIMAFKHEPKARFYFNRNNGVVYFDLIGGAAYSPKKSKMRDIFGGMNPIAVNREFGRADHHEEETIKQVEQLSKGKIKAEIKELGNGVLYKLKDVDQLEEMDFNDPISMRLRADKMKREKEAANPKRRPLYGKQRQKVEDALLYIDQELKGLYSDKKYTLIDMEQEAEPEGGPIADRYGNELNKIENQIQSLIAKRDKLEARLDEEVIKENSRFEKRLAKMAADEKEKRAKSPSYAAASKLDVDVEDFIEKGQSYGEFKKRLDKLKEDKKLTYSDFVDMVRADMRAGAASDENASENQIKRVARWKYDDYLKGISVDDLFEATKEEYNALLDKEYELTKAYNKDKTDANWKKLSAIRKKGKKLEKELEEANLNDPIAMRMRADKMRAANAGDDGNDKFFAKNAKRLSQLKALKDKRAQIMRDMEQEAEMEGGPIADRYGDMLNKIDKAIAMLSEYNTGLYYDPSKEKYAVKAKQASKSGLEKVKDFVKKVMKEEEITVDDATEFKLNLKHLLDKHVVKENEELQVKVGNYQTKHFDICPGAVAVYKDIEVEDMDLAERAAKLQDALFAMEKEALENGASDLDVEAAQILADQIMAMAKMMGLEKEHSYVQGHVEKIKGTLSEALADYEEKEVNYDELYSDYKYKVNEAKPKKGHGEKISKEVFAKLKGKTISYKGDDYKVVDSDEAVLTLKDEDGKTKTINLRQFNVDGLINEILETIALGKNLNEELCPKGKAYIKKRQAAGEKSSAYLSGRAVKVCKGQMKG